MAPHVANFLLGSFGIVAAVLLIGGSTYLRAQKNRYRYELMRRAIDTNTPLPDGQPLWLASRRQAWSILAVAVGLVLVGAVAWNVGAQTTMPATAVVPTAAASINAVPSPTTAEALPPTFAELRPRPPRPDPLMDAWHAAQQRVAIGQTAVGCGVVLGLLGLVRLAFTRIERRVEVPAAVSAGE